MVHPLSLRCARALFRGKPLPLRLQLRDALKRGLVLQVSGEVPVVTLHDQLVVEHGQIPDALLPEVMVGLDLLLQTPKLRVSRSINFPLNFPN